MAPNIFTKRFDMAKGKVKTMVETYPLAEAPKAYQRVVDGNTGPLPRRPDDVTESSRPLSKRCGCGL
jgi:hypothetical protein